MQELCDKINLIENKLYQYFNFFTEEELKSTPINNDVRLLIKSLSALYRKQEKILYSHFSTK